MSVGLGVTPSSSWVDQPPVPAVMAQPAVAGEDAGAGFVPPVYPYDKLAELAELAERHEGGAVDLSVGTPCDPPPARVLEALATSGTERGYPSSIGTAEHREAAPAGVSRGLGVDPAARARWAVSRPPWGGCRAGGGSIPPSSPSRCVSGPR